MIKVDIISGFLGAGKTTIIKKLFESVLKNEKVVLIENEFGEIGIDSSFLNNSGIEIKEINAGCICCSLVGDFTSSIKELVEKYHPERIIIEPSGVGKLSDIITAVTKVDSLDLSLNIIATVVDGPKTKMYLKNFGEFFIDQVENAATIIISKTEKMSEHQLDETSHTIKHLNHQANIITTSVKEFDSDELLKLLESSNSLQKEFEESTLSEVEHHHDHCCCHENHHDEHSCHESHHHEECECHHDHHHDHCCCHEEHHHDEHSCHEGHHHDECECHHDHHHDHCCCHEEHHHADEIFTSYGKETAKTTTLEKLNKFLNELNENENLGIVLRAKGIIKSRNDAKWYHFDYVSGTYEIREGNADACSRIVVIGSKLNTELTEELVEELLS